MASKETTGVLGRQSICHLDMIGIAFGEQLDGSYM